MDRRDFIRSTVGAGAGWGLLSQAGQGAEAPEAEIKMPRRTLGKTGETVPVLMMGTCQELDPRYDKRLHRAFQMGVDYIDTAQMYANGQSQKQIAPFIKQVGGREKLWLTTKVHLKIDEATPAKYEENLDSCLADLEVDNVDLFLMHMAHDERYLGPEFLAMGEHLKKSGKIRYFGFSAHDGSVPRMLTKAAEVGGVDAILFRYNFREYGDVALNKAIDAAHGAGIGLIAMKTLAAIPDDGQELETYLSKDFTPVQAKLKAVLADERISGIASQMSNVEQVMENTAAALSPKQLAMSDFMQLNRYAAQTASAYCNGCGRCEDASEGCLRIGDTLRYVMYHECYAGQREEAKRLFARLTPEERAFAQVDLRAAEAACPRNIPIRQRLAEAEGILSA